MKPTERETQTAMPQSVEQKLNGIDTQALHETIDAIKADPSKATCSFFSTTKWRHGTVSDTIISKYELGGAEIPQDYTIRADEPRDLLGSDMSPNPQMLLFAALSSCVLNTFVVNAAAKGIPIDTLEIEVEGELDLHGFLGINDAVNPGYDELNLVCRVTGDGTQKQYEECLEAGTRYSPNFQSISKAVKINYLVLH